MTYYTVNDLTTTTYTVTVGSNTCYTVGNPSTTYYTSILVAVRTWLTLGNQGLKLWAKLKAMSLTTWKTLGNAKWFVTFYYKVPLPTTEYYEGT